MKTAISIPDSVFQSAEKLASRLGQSRSQLYTKALSIYIDQHLDTHVTDKLNEIYDTVDSNVDPVLLGLQNKSLLKNNEW